MRNEPVAVAEVQPWDDAGFDVYCDACYEDAETCELLVGLDEDAAAEWLMWTYVVRVLGYREGRLRSLLDGQERGDFPARLTAALMLYDRMNARGGASHA